MQTSAKRWHDEQLGRVLTSGALLALALSGCSGGWLNGPVEGELDQAARDAIAAYWVGEYYGPGGYSQGQESLGYGTTGAHGGWFRRVVQTRVEEEVPPLSDNYFRDFNYASRHEPSLNYEGQNYPLDHEKWFYTGQRIFFRPNDSDNSIQLKYYGQGGPYRRRLAGYAHLSITYRDGQLYISPSIRDEFNQVRQLAAEPIAIPFAAYMLEVPHRLKGRWSNDIMLTSFYLTKRAGVLQGSLHVNEPTNESSKWVGSVTFGFRHLARAAGEAGRQDL